jgi:hypothetical protein
MSRGSARKWPYVFLALCGITIAGAVILIVWSILPDEEQGQAGSVGEIPFLGDSWRTFAPSGTMSYHVTRSFRGRRWLISGHLSDESLRAFCTAGSFDVEYLPVDATSLRPLPPPVHLPAGYDVPYAPYDRIAFRTMAGHDRFSLYWCSENGRFLLEIIRLRVPEK